MKKIIIAIDGYSACGKSSTAKGVAAVLGYSYIDSGAMYRAVTLYFEQNHIDMTDTFEISEALNNIDISFIVNPKEKSNEIYLNGVRVENEIREMYISQKVSHVSKLREVRSAMVLQQKRLGKNKGVVMDGRDIGTVVFPEAELKIFMTANIQQRAKRRQDELLHKGQFVELEELVQNLESRDRIDSTRKESPLRRAEGSFELDTTFLTLEKQIDMVVQMALRKVHE